MLFWNLFQNLEHKNWHKLVPIRFGDIKLSTKKMSWAFQGFFIFQRTYVIYIAWCWLYTETGLIPEHSKITIHSTIFMFFFWSLWGWFDSFYKIQNILLYLSSSNRISKKMSIVPEFYTMIQIIIIVSGRINFFQKLANVIRIFCVQQFINSFDSIVKWIIYKLVHFTWNKSRYRESQRQVWFCYVP